MKLDTLLIGGPLDGKIVQTEGPRFVIPIGLQLPVPVGYNTAVEYFCQNFLYRCHFYRVGFTKNVDLLPSRILELIDKSGLKHIPNT